MNQNDMTPRNKLSAGYAFLALMILLQLLSAVFLQKNTVNGGDGIFTFTLANNPYGFVYIDNVYDRFPEHSGWIDAEILKSQYTVMPCDRFDYSAVYWHQRLDNHPLIYYFLVHTVCSLFPGTYSVMYAMAVNTAFLLLCDLVLAGIFGLFFPGKSFRAAGAVFAVSLIVSFQGIMALPRMYMVLVFFCSLYLYLALLLLMRERWKRSWLCAFFFCVLGGTLTHYYFYVYAAFVTVLTLALLLVEKRFTQLICICCTGLSSIAVSLIAFPWMVWHIFFNQMGKHTDIKAWSFQHLLEYFAFIRDTVFNERGIWALVLLIAAAAAVLYFSFRKRPDAKRAKSAGVMLFSIVFYSLTIFTLDGPVYYYDAPVYIPAAVLAAGCVFYVLDRVLSGKDAGRTEILKTALCLLFCCALFGIRPGAEHALSKKADMDQWKVFHEVALNQEPADCIFVEDQKDNLLRGLWLEFGEYDEFKKVSPEEFAGAVKADPSLTAVLSGRTSEDPVYVYIAEELVPEGMSGTLEASARGWQIIRVSGDGREMEENE